MEIVQSNMTELTEAMKALAAADAPQAKAAKQAELLKQAYQRAVAHMKELSDLIQQSNAEALSLINQRFVEAMDEVKALAEKAEITGGSCSIICEPITACGLARRSFCMIACSSRPVRPSRGPAALRAAWHRARPITGMPNCPEHEQGDFQMTAASAAVTPSGLSEAEHNAHLRRALIASTVGTTIEWYDFLLYGTVTGLVFGKLFFPKSTRSSACSRRSACSSSALSGGRSARRSSAITAIASAARRP